MRLILISSLILISQTLFANELTLTNSKKQANHLYENLRVLEDSETYHQDLESVYDELLSRDYSIQKIHTEIVSKKIKKTSWGQCEKVKELIAGKNIEIREYVKNRPVKELAWPVKNILAFDYFKGIKLIEYTQCLIRDN